MNPNECNVQLKWNDFQTNLPLSLQNVRESKDFSDVTLLCDEYTIFEAHRIILAAGSLFFEKVLRRSGTGYHPHPLIYLRGFHETEVSALLDYLYTGETRIQQQYLKSFLSMAQQLGIRGLMEDTSIEKSEDQYDITDQKPAEFDGQERFFEIDLQSKKARYNTLLMKIGFDKPEEQPNFEEPKPVELGANNTSFEHEIKSNGVKNQKIIKDNDHIKVKVCALQTEIQSLQKEILMQEAADRSNWILQSVDTFPKLPMEMREIMAKANSLKPYACSVLKWFLKPLQLKHGRKSFAGWGFLVSPADFHFSKHLLKELGEADFSLTDIIDWSCLSNYKQKKQHAFSHGNSEDLKEASGVKCWLQFIKIFIEWAFVVVDIQPDNWVSQDSP